jgi:hypothetical protein
VPGISVVAEKHYAWALAIAAGIDDSIGATRNADGSPRYYDGFTWAFNSTAAPTTYSHTELV